MADAKITELTELTTVDDGDLLAIVDDPSGSPITKKISRANLLLSSGGVAFPYMMQSDSTTQAIASSSTAQVITFDTDIYHSGIARTSSSRFTVGESGAYLMTISAIADAATGTNQHINIWLRKNGSDVANSNTILNIATSSIETIIAVSFIDVMVANDYFELWMSGDSTNIRLLATGAGTTPTRPACPSIIITCNKVSKT